MERGPTVEASPAMEELLALTTGGRSVIVTRAGRPIAEVRPIGDGPADPPTRPADLGWLRRHRVGRLHDGDRDAGELVSRMRDEEWR